MISELQFLTQVNDKLQTLAMQVGMIGEVEDVLALVETRMFELQQAKEKA
jgi:hypothetical protein